LVRHSAPVCAIAAVDLDGKTHIISGDDAGGLRLTAFDTSSQIDLVGHARAVLAVTPVTLHGRPHALTGGLDRSMRLWDLTAGRQLDDFWFPAGVVAITVAEDGTVFVGVGPDVISLTPDAQRLPLRPYTAP
jgi:WD40 repeat protein